MWTRGNGCRSQNRLRENGLELLIGVSAAVGAPARTPQDDREQKRKSLFGFWNLGHSLGSVMRFTYVSSPRQDRSRPLCIAGK